MTSKKELPKAKEHSKPEPKETTPKVDRTKLPYGSTGDVQNAINKAHRNADAKALSKIGDQFGVKYDPTDYAGFRKKVFAVANKVL